MLYFLPLTEVPLQGAGENSLVSTGRNTAEVKCHIHLSQENKTCFSTWLRLDIRQQPYIQ